MMKQALAYTMFFGMVFSLPAAADDAVLQFNHGIGVDPVSNVTGCPATPLPCVTGVTGAPLTVVLNIVRGQIPGGQIWVINKLKAQVSANGSIQVSGKGLVLGGGNGAGGAPANLKVFATLSCSSTANFLLSTTTLTGVPVSPTGDFQINDMLTPAPTFPCANPLLLIQSTAAGMHWFALGIVGSDDD
jgi:hypothetical protein